MVRPFRFSLAMSGITDPTQLLETARRAEDLGYSSVAYADHLDDQLAPIPALTAMAGVTSSLRLLTQVLANDYRHPAVLAKEAATLDQLSGGRLELGLGAGWMRSDYDGAGIAHDPAGVRIDRLAEAVTVLDGLFGEGPFSFEGDHYRITELDGRPLPVQRPRPPLMLAGGRPRILGLAARHADIIGLNPSLAAGVIDERAGATATPNATDEKLTWIRDAAGDRFDEIEVHTRVHLAMISDDREGVAEMMGPALGIDPADALASPHALVGTVAQCVDTLHAWRERWSISYVGLPSDVVEDFAPVVAALA